METVLTVVHKLSKVTTKTWVLIKSKNGCWAHTFYSSIQETEAGGSLSLVPAWTTYGIPG